MLSILYASACLCLCLCLHFASAFVSPILQKNGGTMVICHALTFSLQVGQIKAEMSEATSAYLDKIPDKNQYMASAGKMHGWKTQGPSESAHHANAASRNLHPVEALMTQVRADQKRFFRRRTEAHNQH